MKPNLAANYDEQSLLRQKGTFVVLPKIDGVRGLTTEGFLHGRSLKKHKNKHTTNVFSAPEYGHMDGELTLTSAGLCHPRLCNLTQSAVGSIEGAPDVTWNIFDMLTDEALKYGYKDRIKMVHEYLAKQHALGLCLKAQPVEFHIVKSGDEVLALDQQYLDAGYEGTIYRMYDSLHKQGRSTLKQGGLIRIKRFIEEEAVVTGFEEGDKNQNEAQTNELGHTYRTSHKEGKVPNGQIGTIYAMWPNGEKITVAPGTMDHDQRKYYFEHPDQFIGRTIKVKHFPKGVKDKPRFPTFQGFRDDEDISEG